MKTVFIGGSRHVSRLPPYVRERLDGIVEQRHRVVVGDANGADKAVQRHYADAGYDSVVVFCSGDRPRNNVADWPVHAVDPGNARGFQFHAAKDRAMAQEADAGLMIWDGKSAGTLLNILRLARTGKKAVLATVADKSEITIRSDETWHDLFSHLSASIRADLRERATPEEWAFAEPTGTSLPLFGEEAMPDIDRRALVEVMNAALRTGDAAAFLSACRDLTHDPDGEARGDTAFGDVLALLATNGIGLRAAAGRR